MGVAFFVRVCEIGQRRAAAGKCPEKKLLFPPLEGYSGRVSRKGISEAPLVPLEKTLVGGRRGVFFLVFCEGYGLCLR